jgi:hypothetical protein
METHNAFTETILTMYPAFTETLALTHLARRKGETPAVTDDFALLEAGWLTIYGVGKLELYQFLYSSCESPADFLTWLRQLKGEEWMAQADLMFAQWSSGQLAAADTIVPYTLLNPQQLEQWETQGYLRVSGLVPDTLCDAVKQFICDHQQIDLTDTSTWYPNASDWHGLMLQVYQHPTIEAIRMHPQVKQLFAELYQTQNILPNTDKVSYNPPETEQWRFRHNHLHWDIDMDQPAAYYIQGLIYLDDVPENRGPLRLVPGFHQRFDEYVQQFETSHQAQHSIRDLPEAIAVPGRKGDVVVWLQTLPHAASANHSELPRFVQYLSFTKM